MTWLEKFDRFVAAQDEASVDTDNTKSNIRDALEALLDRYRDEGYPGMDAEIPPDLLVH